MNKIRLTSDSLNDDCLPQTSSDEQYHINIGILSLRQPAPEYSHLNDLFPDEVCDLIESIPRTTQSGS
jgi:hypothetical protein